MAKTALRVWFLSLELVISVRTKDLGGIVMRVIAWGDTR